MVFRIQMALLLEQSLFSGPPIALMIQNPFFRDLMVFIIIFLVVPVFG